jgi:hypothetical protein
MEHGGQRRPDVLDVRVDIARDERPIADQGAAKIQTAIDRQPRVALDGLREQFTKHQLFGEILRPDPDRARAHRAHALRGSPRSVHRAP